MTVEFVRFKASDEVELQGWLTNVDGGSVVVHIHGMSGNGYENQFLDTLRETYAGKGISFFSIDTRGRVLSLGSAKAQVRSRAVAVLRCSQKVPMTSKVRLIT